MTVADVEKLLHDFIEEDRTAGPADPLRYVERLEGIDRAELEALIDGYLARAPRRAFDAEAFERSPARGVAEELARALGGVSGTWPAQLPRLRHRAQIARSEVVRRLADELGARDTQTEKVTRYYHAMEQGTLPSGGVSDRVLEALGSIVGATAERLRTMGQALGAASRITSSRLFSCARWRSAGKIVGHRPLTPVIAGVSESTTFSARDPG